ncbi:transposase [Wukongibacter sp. M2B1]|uniref:transposase n=1 Tax=Wukongibacter sp. M2B1 TaxID=3088895 RepID=UPI003D7B2240
MFEVENRKEEYLRIIRKYKEIYKFKIYSYCNMNNHSHLLIKVEKILLSKIIKVCTQRYNTAKKETCHVFERRYKVFLCDKDTYLLNLVRYIQQNLIKDRKQVE